MLNSVFIYFVYLFNILYQILFTKINMQMENQNKRNNNIRVNKNQENNIEF